MANLKNAALRKKITDAFLDCMQCNETHCADYCMECVQTTLDEIIDEIRMNDGKATA